MRAVAGRSPASGRRRPTPPEHGAGFPSSGSGGGGGKAPRLPLVPDEPPLLIPSAPDGAATEWGVGFIRGKERRRRAPVFPELHACPSGACQRERAADAPAPGATAAAAAAAASTATAAWHAAERGLRHAAGRRAAPTARRGVHARPAAARPPASPPSHADGAARAAAPAGRAARPGRAGVQCIWRGHGRDAAPASYAELPDGARPGDATGLSGHATPPGDGPRARPTPGTAALPCTAAGLGAAAAGRGRPIPTGHVPRLISTQTRQF